MSEQVFTFRNNCELIERILSLSFSPFLILSVKKKNCCDEKPSHLFWTP